MGKYTTKKRPGSGASSSVSPRPLLSSRTASAVSSNQSVTSDATLAYKNQALIISDDMDIDFSADTPDGGSGIYNMENEGSRPTTSPGPVVVQGPTSEKVYTDLPKQMEKVITGTWSAKPMKSPRGTPDII